MSDAVPDEILRSLLRAAFDGRATLGEVRPLAGDASSRTYFRISLRGAGPPTAVLLVQSGSGLSVSSDELARIAETPREMPFLNVQRYLAAIGMAVPEVYAAEDARGLALLEDIGDLTLWDAAQAATSDGALALFRSAIDEMIALQRAGRERPDPSCIAFQQRFDAVLFLWEFDHFLEYGLVGRDSDPAQRSDLRRRFAELADALGAEPPVLTHRDYHSWNLFVQDGRIRVIDFQDALLAPAPYDLATLLNDRATPTLLQPTLEPLLIEHYCRRLEETTGEAVDRRSFRDGYHRFVLQKSLKVLGRFIYLEDVKGKRGYRAMLPETLRTLRRSLDNLPDLKPIRKLLARSFSEVA